MGSFWKGLAPVVAAIVIALIPAPGGLAQHTWYYFAIFAGVIVGLMLEPIPGAAIGLIAVTLVTVSANGCSFPDRICLPFSWTRRSCGSASPRCARGGP